MNYGDFPIEETIHVFFTTRAFATGIPGTLSAATVAVYEDITATPIETSIAVTESLNSIAGLNAVPIVAIAASGYEVGKNYHVVIEAGTVDSVSVVGEVVAYFSIGRSAAAVDLANGTDGLTALKTVIDGIPTTAEFEARTIVAANYFDPGADTVATVTTVTNQLSAATIANQVWDTDATGRQTQGTFGQAIGDPVADADTIYGSVVTGAAGANISVDIIALKAETVLILADTDDIGVAGAGLTDLGGMSDGMKAEVESEVNDGLVALGLDHLISAAVSDTDVADNSIIAEMTDAGSTSDYTNYSKTEDSLRAISEKVSSIGSALGGGFNFAAVGADALTDTINDAEDAVDKSTSPATVGIPVTGHAFLAGHEVTIAGTANYNGSFVIDSVSASEVVIVSAFLAETFSSTDTIVSSIKGESIEGVETTNTFAVTVSEDGIYHVIDDDGANNFTISYRYEIGGGRLATEAVFHGFLNSNNDNAFIQAYDFVGDAWETRALLTGQNGSVNQTITVSLLARNTGTDAIDLGVVFLRITDDTPRGSSNPTLNVDSFLVEAQGVGQTAGYQNGRIALDTNNGTAGAEAFVNGVADKPCLILADAKALSTSIAIGDFHIINGSSITLVEGSTNESYFGDNWTLALGGQDVDGAYFQGPHVSGVGVSATEVHFEGCDIATASIQRGHFDFCSFDGTVTHTLAGDYNYHNCYSKVPGVGGPTFTKTSGQVVTTQFRNWSGSITVSGIEASDVMTISGTELGDVVLNGAEGTVKILGIYESLTDNRTGSPTLIEGAFEGSDVTDILADTVEIGTAGAGLSNINLPNQTMDIIGDITGNLSGSVGSVTGAVGSVAGNVDGNVTGSVGSLAAQAVTDILTTQMTEAYNADGTAPTLAQALFMILQQAGEFSISGTTITVKKLDGSTTAATFTLDDGSDPTSRTRAT